MAPSNSRDERLNIGVAVFRHDQLDIRLTKRLEKIRALSGSLDFEVLRSLMFNFGQIDSKNREKQLSDIDRHKALANLGPIKLSDFGRFVADNANVYEDRVRSIFTLMIDPEPAIRRVRGKSSPLISQIRRYFRQEKVLAARGESIESHRIIQKYEIDEGLVADFVLKNGAMHVVETVDAAGDDAALKRAIADVALSALILERAKINYGSRAAKPRLVYDVSSKIEKQFEPALLTAEHQGIELINWQSTEDRGRFIGLMSSLAEPAPPKTTLRKPRLVASSLFD